MELKAIEKETDDLPRRVLVVEDDALLALSIEDMLEEAGVEEITVSPTAERAIKALDKAPPDAIILDVHLADRRDGWALAELVACLGPPRPKIVFSTAAPEEIPPEIARLGTVFEKPYDPALLLDAIAKRGTGRLFSRFRA